MIGYSALGNRGLLWVACGVVVALATQRFWAMPAVAAVVWATLVINYLFKRSVRRSRARYRVIAIASGAVLLDATAGSDAGIDRVSSDYAVVAAETTALDRLSVEVARQISARIAEVARAGKLYPAAP